MKVKDILWNNKTEIVKFYTSGISTCELGKRFGVSNASIYLFLRDDCGVEIRKRPSIDDYKDKILPLYDKGLSCYGIARQVGLNKSTCERYCRKLGLDFSANSKNRDVPVKTQIDQIIKDYENGLGCTRLSKKYNTTETTINKLLRTNGYKARYLHTYSIPKKFFDQIDTEEKSYILGIFTADGHNAKNCTFQIQLVDKQIVHDIKIAMGYTGPIYERISGKPNRKPTYTLNIYSRRICQRLSELGCPNCKTFITKMPDETDLPKSLVVHYIRGLLDGDGSFHTCGKNLVCTMAGTIDILTSIQMFLKEEIGIDSKIYYHNNKTYILRVHKRKDLSKFVTWLYKDATIYLHRKYNIAKPLIIGEEK